MKRTFAFMSQIDLVPWRSPGSCPCCWFFTELHEVPWIAPQVKMTVSDKTNMPNNQLQLCVCFVLLQLSNKCYACLSLYSTQTQSKVCFDKGSQTSNTFKNLSKMFSLFAQVRLWNQIITRKQLFAENVSDRNNIFSRGRSSIIHKVDACFHEDKFR